MAEKEYIERKAAEDIVENIILSRGFDRRSGQILIEIQNIPAADVAPVVQGSFNHTGSYWSCRWICTNCNEIAYYPPHGNRKKRTIQPCSYKFCPNCGARMDGEESENDD